ncbi:FMN-dependent nitroreductase-like domain-containing protein [Advenella mimigardefordensis DPN7]|uniref:FMN-dependent nitroreductase-like domain-containing protein n=2 Tax=Advenella mimigardefordensis TaxID=302406 RepID=W0PKT4_ADVMD|nr:FMN-dependent nitroreductase-like domain-containing protein [Advenella mimigardefordensis DPN7]
MAAGTAQDLLKARYQQAAFTPDEVNATIETLFNHRSVRAYTDETLKPGTLELLVAAAQSASTSSNLQTWSVVVVQDAQSKDRLAQLAGNQEHVRRCPLFLVWVADLSRFKSLGVKHGVPHDGLTYMEAFLLASIDSALAAQNAAVAAESMGLGVVFIGGMRNHPEEVAKELGLPDYAFATFGMCIGYPDPLKPASVKPRLPQAAVLHKEKYDASALEPAAQSYNATMDDFYKAQGMKNSGPWDLHSLNRLRGPEALTGRDRLVEALKNLGFDLR